MANLIWATALFIPLMILVLGLLGPLRRAATALGDEHGRSAAERDAKAALDLAGAEESRHVLAVRRGALEQETAREIARLAMETAQFEADAAAARQCIPAAVKARTRALEARADAEAEIAPEAARKALEGGNAEQMASLSQAYAAYCNACHGTPALFGEFTDGFEGLSHG